MFTPQLPLSVLELSVVDAGSTPSQALRNTIAIARTADALGYRRFWMAEHHNTRGIASSAPEIMIGHVAAETATIRVGSGGIMLPNHAPLKVAETFRMLEALHPGRVDLGIGRAPGTDGITARALRRTTSGAFAGAEDFPEQLAELMAFAGESDGFPEGHPYRNVVAVPAGVALPPIWLLGSSDYSAQLSAAWGLRFAFAAHINREGAVPAMRLYRDTFRPSEALPEPYAMLTVSVIVGETDTEAEHLSTSVDLSYLRLITGRHGPVVSPEEAAVYPYTATEREQIRGFHAKYLIGSAATVRDQILDLVAATAADEVMVTTMVYGVAQRRRAYELLAAAFGLAGHGITPAPELALAGV